MKKQSEKSKRAQIAYAFECAKQYLWDGATDAKQPSFEFICGCLDHTHDCGEITRDVWIAALDVIGDRLGHTETLEGWLNAQGITDTNGPSSRLQAHRLAWLNLLIAEFRRPAK